MAERPTGTVTFLFTDIEGSTRRWEHQPAAMTQAFAQQEHLLRQAIAAHGGYAYKQVGDGFQAAFQTAPAALAAAVAAQRALAAAAWDGIDPVRVRMALHTGSTEERPEDYVGPPLYRVARLLTAGHGGQILLTQATYELVREVLPTGVSLRDLGDRRLRDLIRPEHVWEAVLAEERAHFPPLKTLDSRSHNLPRQTTTLIGREREWAAVVGLLRQPAVALLTLTGPGGIGKTRLGLQVAAELLDEYADGVWFVELAALTDAAVVASTIAQTLGVAEVAGRSLLEGVTDYLRAKRLLLVLDNFEQVLPAANLVEALLQAAPGVKILVTSRVPLHLYGEKEYPVPPLTVPDPQHLPTLQHLTEYEAVRLFIERAQDVQPDFAVTDATAPIVAQICRRLDGLPLALELAAARVRLFPLSTLLTRLDQRFRVLTGGPRNVSTRHQTLWAAIDWSYQLLSAAEQQFFRRLAVFQGGRTLDALDAVCNADRDLGVDVLAGTEALVSHSLLQQREGPGGDARFWLLETIHEYAREQLAASGEEPALRDYHLAYFLTLAEAAEKQLEGPQQTVWLEALAAEHDNLRAALAWALPGPQPDLGLRLAAAIWPFWGLHGHLAEGRTWLARAVLESATALPALQARLYTGSGSLAWRQADYARSTEYHARALELYRAIGDQRGIAFALNNVGVQLMCQGEFTQCRQFLEESLCVRRQIGDQPGIAMMLNNLGVLALYQGDAATARPVLVESLALYRQLQNKRTIANTLDNLGDAALHEGEWGEAQQCFRESLGLHRELGSKAGLADALDGLAKTAAAQDHGTRAARLFGAAATLREVIEAPLSPVVRRIYERHLAAAHALLAPAAWDAAWAAGQQMALDQAVAYALEQDAEG